MACCVGAFQRLSTCFVVAAAMAWAGSHVQIAPRPADLLLATAAVSHLIEAPPLPIDSLSVHHTLVDRPVDAHVPRRVHGQAAGVGESRTPDGSDSAVDATPSPAASGLQTYVNVPMVFEPNRGQASADAAFVARGRGYTLEILPLGTRMVLGGEPTSDRAVLDMQLVAPDPQSRVDGQEPQPGRSHYLIGNDPSRHLGDVPHFGRVAVEGIYPGIDLAFYGRQNRLEYDFVVAPGADPERIGLRFSGYEAMDLSADGDLVFRWGGRELRQLKPVLYQLPGREPVRGRFVMAADGTVGFDVTGWDRQTTLVIDPVLSFGTYLGGTGNDTARAVAVDSSGNIYVAGSTTSTNFPTQGPFQGSNGGGSSDAFVTKLNPSGTAIVYSTYLGGTGSDDARGVAVDSAGSAHLIGRTDSMSTFPRVGTFGVQCFFGAYVVKLTPAGNALTYAFCIDGTFEGNAVAVDPSGNVYVTGQTSSGTLATVNAAQPTGAGFDAFVGKYNAAGTTWTYLTYLGGNTAAGGGIALEYPYAIAADSAGNACVTGRTWSSDFPVSNARQPTFGGGIYDAFVTKYNAAGAVTYSTYLGGSSSDTGYGAGLDSSGNCYVVGTTFSADLPLLNAAQPTHKGSSDAFATAYNASGSAYVYSTFLGGALTEAGQAIAVGATGIAHVVGQSASSDFPQQNLLQSSMSDLSAFYASSNGGSSFSRVSMYPLSVNALLVDSADAQILYAGTSNGVHKSTNGGTTWTRVDSGLSYTNVVALAFDPNAPCTILGGVDTAIGGPLNTNAMTIISTDCGASWGYLASGPTGRVTRSISVTSANPSRVYMAVGVNNGLNGVARTTDTGNQVRYFSGVTYVVATDPTNPCISYAANSTGSVLSNTSCSSLDFATTVGSALNGAVLSFVLHPTSPSTMLAGTSLGTIYRKADAASGWVSVATLNGAVRSLAYQKGNPQVVYAGGGGTVYKSTDGGAMWAPTATLGPEISSLAVSPAASATSVFAGTLANSDAFYARLSAAGAILDSSWFGGHGSDFAQGVALDPAGDVVIVGTTAARDFPVTTGTVTTTAPTGGDSFVVKLSASAPCSYSLNSTSTTVGAGATSGTVNVVARLGCAWTAASQASFITITGGASGIGNGQAEFTVAANTGAPRSGTMTIAGQTFTVSQAGQPVAPTSLLFAAVKSITSATLTSVTPAQDVTVTFGAGGGWSASADRPWIQITNGAGTAAGRFTVAIVNPNDVIGASTSLTGTITVSATGGSTSPASVTVTLTVRSPGQTTEAFGSFDTPSNGATVQGSIAVTGWALDDVGIDRVEIWRDLVTGETTVPFSAPGHPGNGKVFIATPLFVAGSRPDVEAAYPASPFAYRAGWGYLLLTWGLWNQGNGQVTLYAFAFDKEGNATTLGTKAITASNNTATKPFGALDTPTYGQTVSGSFWNYGWALTPNPNSSDLRTCLITNGNVSMAIDSGPLTAVSYGDLRTDIAGFFPGFSNGTGSGGAYYIDTTTLTNGVHQIGWYVVDNCGRADGIGSRFFTVLKSSMVTAPDAQTHIGRVLLDPADGPAAPAVVRVRRTIGEWADVPPNAAGVHVVAIEQSERVEVRLPDEGGSGYTSAQVVNGERRALPLGSSLDAEAGIFYWQPAAGFLGGFDLEFAVGARARADVGRVLSDPPGDAGSLFMARGAPPPRARAAALEDSLSSRGAAGAGPGLQPDVVRVRVVVGPPMRMAIDTPQDGATVDSPLVIAGWAIDLAATDGSGIDTVHVWAYPASGGEPIFLGVADVGDARPDVAAIYGAQFDRSSYSLAAPALAPGTYDLVVYPHRAATRTFDGAQAVRVTIQ